MLEIELPMRLREKFLSSQTIQNPTLRKRRKSGPRQRAVKGNKKRHVSFVETRLGRFLYYRCPVEYKIITQTIKKKRIDADFIEQVAYASGNAAFRTEEFRDVLRDYRIHGLVDVGDEKFDVDKEIERIKLRLGF